MKKTFTNKLCIVQLILILLCLCAAFSTVHAQESEAAINAQITDLTSRIAAAPNDDKLYVERGTALMQAQRYDESLSDAAKALQLNPKNDQAVLLRGNVKYERKDYDGAIVDYSAVINPAYRYSDAYFWRGRAYEGKGENEKAIADYNKAAQIQPLVADMMAVYRQRLEAKMKEAQKSSAAPVNSKKANAEPESEFDKIAREEGIMISEEQKARNTVTAAEMEGFLKPENLKAVNNALKNVNETPPAQSKMTELFLRKQGISKKFAEFQTAYAKPLGDSQKLEMLNRIKSEYQTALTEAENAERQNLNYSAEQKKQIADYKTYYSKALGILNGLIADKKPTAANTGEFSKSDLGDFYKQNPNVGKEKFDFKEVQNVGAISAVTSVNRRSFFTGVFFQQTDLLALQSQMLGVNKQETIASMIKRLGALNAVLKGKPEAADLTEAYKKLQQSKNIQEFQKDLGKINSKYEASLSSEQKWYFKIGIISATVQYGAVNKQHIWFVTTKEDFSEIVKSSPAGTSPLLQTSLKKMSQYANSRDLTAVNSDSEYASLGTQIKEIFDSIGQLKNEDMQATSSLIGAEVKQFSDNSDKMDEMARKGDGSPYHLASHKLTYEYGKLQQLRQDVETELMAKGNPGDPMRKKKFLADAIALSYKDARIDAARFAGASEIQRFALGSAGQSAIREEFYRFQQTN